MRGGAYLALILALHVPSMAVSAADRDGQSLYEYYCYQCHGYAGDAATLARNMLQPPPRDFTRSSPEELTRERMITAVSEGRSGTGMVSFAAVMTPVEREAVVDYIRTTLLGTHDAQKRYHTPENGWPDMERYRAAWPFVTGELSLSTPVSELDDTALSGRRQYFNACISCHEAVDSTGDGTVFRLRSVSFPYMPYDEEDVADDSVFNLHRRPVGLPENASVSLTRGAELYARDCASCHAVDGTGRNWVGSFLVPGPPDLASGGPGPEFDADERPVSDLRQLILNGIAGSSMPAFRHVLSDTDVDDLMVFLAYLRQPTHSPNGQWQAPSYPSGGVRGNLSAELPATSNPPAPRWQPVTVD